MRTMADEWGLALDDGTVQVLPGQPETADSGENLIVRSRGGEWVYAATGQPWKAAELIGRLTPATASRTVRDALEAAGGRALTRHVTSVSSRTLGGTSVSTQLLIRKEGEHGATLRRIEDVCWRLPGLLTLSIEHENDDAWNYTFLHIFRKGIL